MKAGNKESNFNDYNTKVAYNKEGEL